MLALIRARPLDPRSSVPHFAIPMTLLGEKPHISQEKSAALNMKTGVMNTSPWPEPGFPTFLYIFLPGVIKFAVIRRAFQFLFPAS
jgi:hypothetical protein